MPERAQTARRGCARRAAAQIDARAVRPAAAAAHPRVQRARLQAALAEEPGQGCFREPQPGQALRERARRARGASDGARRSLAVLLASPPAVCPSPGRLRRASLPAAPAPQADGQRLEAVDPGRAPPREANLSLSVGCAADAAGNGPTARPANATLTPALVASERDTATRLRRGGPALGTSRGCASTVPASPAPGPSRLSNSRAYLPPPSPRPRAPRDPPRDGPATRARRETELRGPSTTRPRAHTHTHKHTRAHAHARAHVHNGILVAPCTMKRQRHRLCVFLVHGDMNEDHARPPSHPSPRHTHTHARAHASPQRVPGGAVHC